MIKKIGVLTSGGDAPGMNAAIRSVVRTATALDIEVYGITEGYYGLYHNHIQKLCAEDVSGKILEGGTFLGSARFPEFADEEIRKDAIKNLDHHGIQALIVIGGDGSFVGAARLSEMGYPCIGVPGTIDNDAPNTDFTIGFDTALNTIVEAVDRLRDTSSSHRRCSVVEVMGRNAGDLALWAGIATGADFTLIPEIEVSVDEVVHNIKDYQNAGRKHFIVIIAEGLSYHKELIQAIEKETGVETRGAVLGHIQRGGRPTGFDRVLASRMGSYAVELLRDGHSSVCVGIVDNELVNNDIIKSVGGKHFVDEQLYTLANKYLNIKK